MSPALKKERKKRLTSLEMEQMRNLCRDRIITDLRLQNAAPGMSLPGERILSDRYDIPLSVVRATLTAMKNDGLIESILREGMHLISLPSLPQTLKGCKFIFVATIDKKNPWSQLNRPVVICTWMERQLKEQGGTVEFINTMQYKNAAVLKEKIKNSNPDAIIFMQDTTFKTIPVQDAFPETVPVVAIEADLPDTDAIYFDDKSIGQTQAKYILDCGHRKTAIFYFESYEWSLIRKQTILAEYARRGIPPPDLYPFPYDRSTEVDMIHQVIREHGREYTAIHCINDRLAVYAVQAAEECGIDIPEELSIIGADDQAEFRHLNLTTIQLLPIDLGNAAFENLKAKLLNPSYARPPHKTMLPCPLIVRKTTKKLSVQYINQQEVVS